MLEKLNIILQDLKTERDFHHEKQQIYIDNHTRDVHYGQEIALTKCIDKLEKYLMEYE